VLNQTHRSYTYCDWRYIKLEPLFVGICSLPAIANSQKVCIILLSWVARPQQDRETREAGRAWGVGKCGLWPSKIGKMPMP